MDALADLLNSARAHSAAFCRTVLEPPWALRIADEAPLALATVLSGHAWIVPDDGPTEFMKVGDVVIVKGPDHYTVGDDPATEPDIVVHPGNRLTRVDGTDITARLRLGPNTSGERPDGSAVVVSGAYRVGGDVGARLLDALPRMLVVPAADIREPITALLAEEVSRDAPGQQLVLDRLLPGPRPVRPVGTALSAIPSRARHSGRFMISPIADGRSPSWPRRPDRPARHSPGGSPSWSASRR